MYGQIRENLARGRSAKQDFLPLPDSSRFSHNYLRPRDGDRSPWVFVDTDYHRRFPHQLRHNVGNRPPDNVTGSFTFDTSDGATGTESNVMITVTGTEFAGTYTQLAATAAFATNIITAFDSGTAVTVQISFEDPLNVTPDPLAPEGIMGFTGEFPPTSYDFTSGDATVATSATPLPPALPLLAAGLGAMGLVGWRRKRKALAVAA